MRPARADFLAECLERIGTPYLWGGKSSVGLDCSGLVTYALSIRGGRDLRRTHNTDRLWAELHATLEPQPGDLAFYGGTDAADVEHVMVCVAKPGLEWLVVGATGGGRSTTTTERAREVDARVKTRPTHLYRPDFRGFRSMATLLGWGGA